jgi:hypothetical protein
MTDILAAEPNVHRDGQSDCCSAADERNDEVSGRAEDYSRE